MVVRVFNLSTLVSEAGGSLRVLGQPGLPSESWASQGYSVRPCLK